MMFKVIICCIIFFCINSIGNASNIIGDIDWENIGNAKVYPKYTSVIESRNQKYLSLNMTYPFICTPLSNVQEKINKDIENNVSDFKDKYDSGMFFKGYMDFEKVYEDAFRISIVLKERWWDLRERKEQYKFIGLVYDKSTGEKVLVKDYMPNLKLKELELVLDNNIARVVNEKGELVNNKDIGRVNQISDDFIILDIYTIALIYQPGEIASVSDGVIYFVLNERVMDYINRVEK